MNRLFSNKEEIMKKKKFRKRWKKVVSVMICLVVFCTTYALILPAITLEKDAVCGTEEHENDEFCYSGNDTDENLIEKTSQEETDEGSAVLRAVGEDYEMTVTRDESTGTISAGKNVTIGIGDTVTLTGTSGNADDWLISTEGIVTLEKSGEAKAIVTGVSEGTVEITHQYKKNNKTETYTVTVTGSSETDDSEVEKKAEKQGYTVTVKGNKQILQDAELFVEEIDPAVQTDYYMAMVQEIDSSLSTNAADKDTVFDFLKMYHIYLSKDEGKTEYDPAADDELKNVNINLQVTITYDSAPDGWPSGNGNLYVGHFKKNGDTIENKGFTDGAGIKQIKVSGNSVTFHIQGFSVFPLAVPANGSGNSSGNGEAAPADGSILTPKQLSWIKKDGSNEWQIVDQEYADSTAASKKASSDGSVRVQKNVIPTGVENEFLVYLSIDTKQLFADYFASAQYEATTSNNYGGSDLGTVVTHMTGNQKVKVTGKETNGYNSANFTILSSNGELLAENVTLYWSQANNVTFYLKVDDNGTTKYVLIGLSVKSNDNEVVMLSEESERLIMSSIAQMSDLEKVTDVMGEYIDFVSVVSGNYDDEPVYDESTGTLTWIPTVKDNPTIDKVKTDESKTVKWTDHDGNVRTETVYKYTSWAMNVSELVYKVKLDVAKAGFHSAAENMDSSAEEKESYAVNESAVLTYGDDKAVEFQVPHVRGLLYDIRFEKIDKDTKKKLSGAEFELEDSNGTPYKISELGGTYRAEDLPWGIYTLIEVKAPTGYKISGEQSPWKIEVCYTKDKSNIEKDSQKPSNMLFIGNSIEGVWQIENESAIYVDLLKTDMSYNALAGAVFSIYDKDPSTAGAEPISRYANVTVNSDGFIADNMKLEDGSTYYIVENQAPDGYVLPNGNVMLKVDLSNIENPIVVSGGVGTFEITSEEQTIDGSSTTVYVVKIPNNPGVKLPETGGTGTLPYTLGGLGFILISCLMYGYSMRRKQERRLK